MRLHQSALTLVVCAGLLGPALPGASAAEDPGLGKSVPSTVHLYSHWKSTPETDALAEPFLDAVRKLRDSGIGKDLFELATIELNEREREEARHWVREVVRLVGSVDWLSLVSTEGAFAFRMSFPIPEYLFLGRVPGEGAAQRYEELRGLMHGIAGYTGGKLSVTDAERMGAKVSTLRAGGVPIGISAAVHGETVVLCTSDFLLDDVLRRMESDDVRGSVIDDPRFQDAVKGLPESRASVTYFDMSGYMGFIRSMMGMAAGAVQNDENARAGVGILTKIIDELAKMQSIGVTERVEANRYFTDGRIALSQSGGTGFIEKLIADQEPVGDYASGVPSDAISFYVSSGIRPVTVYDAILGLISEIPDARYGLEEFAEFQKQVGVNVREDLLSWIDGGWGQITLPPKTPGGCPECVCFLRLRDEQKAQAFWGAVWEISSGYVRGRGHGIELVEAPDVGERFRKLKIDALPWMQPVFGMPDGKMFVMATSEHAAKRVRDTIMGESASILESSRFTAVGKPPEGGKVCEVFYYDVEGELTAGANALGTLGFFLSLLPERMPKGEDLRPAIKLGTIFTKFAQFLRDVDLTIDCAGWTRYDPEAHALQVRRTVLFRKPRSTTSEL